MAKSKTEPAAAAADSKPKRVKAPKGEPVSLASLGFETFEVVEIQRDALKNAPYNPRVITDTEKRKLKAGLKKHGMVVPVTWNRRSGNIVGGNQRVSVLDALAGTFNYTLRVASIDVDDTREKELNVLLNNPQAMGDWDIAKLKDIFSDKSLDIEGMGFDNSDLFQLFGDDIFADEGPGKLDELAQKVREFQALYTEIESKNSEKGSEDFYLVVVFKDGADRTAFITEAGLKDNRYQSGQDFRKLANLEISAESAPATS